MRLADHVVNHVYNTALQTHTPHLAHTICLFQIILTCFSKAVRNASSTASRNSMMGLSCVTLWISSSLQHSKRAVNVSSSAVLSGGKKYSETQEKK